MNKKGLSLDKELIVVVLILLVFGAIVFIGFTTIYSKTKTSQEGLQVCENLGGECTLKDTCPQYGQEIKNSSCKKNETCCVTKESIVGLT